MHGINNADFHLALMMHRRERVNVFFSFQIDFYSFVGFIADVPSRLLFVCGFYRGSCECFLAVYVQATLLEQTLRRSFLLQTTTKNNVAAICFTLWPGCVTYMCFSGGGRWS